jgi:hypothetical protein
MDSITHNFERALEILKREDNPKVCRTGWNGKNMYLQMQHPDEHSKMQLPYIYICTADGQLVPWVASQTDLLANDWQPVYDTQDDLTELNAKQ